VKRILIACEFSGTVREAFKKVGWDAWSCDILPTEIPGNHIQDDVLNHLGGGWDMMIAHPPCTYLTNSGVTWLHKDAKRWIELFNAALFFKKLLNANIPKICVENPIQHKYAKAFINQEYTQIIQPWMFGHPESKATCLWLKGLPELKETDNVKEEMLSLPDNQRQRLHYLPPSEDRWKLRSKTFQGIADAISEQWTNIE